MRVVLTLTCSILDFDCAQCTLYTIHMSHSAYKKYKLQTIIICIPIYYICNIWYMVYLCPTYNLNNLCKF